MRIPSGVTDQYIYFVAVDATDLKTRETGLSSFAVYRSRNGGAATAMTTPTVTEVDGTNMPGVYKLLLDEDMTLDAGDESQEMLFHLTCAGMAPVTRTIELYQPLTQANVRTAVGLASANLDTQLGDIHAKTTNLPSDPADASDIAALFATVNSKLDTLDDFLDTEIAAILADTTALNDEALADSIPVDGSLGTLKQTLYEIRQFLFEASVSGTTVTSKKVDGSTTLETFTTNSATAPTSISRSG